MQVGISTACFYPQETEQALRELLRAGVKQVEIFVNCPSEISCGYIDRMRGMLQESGAQVCALHPYSSWQEHWYFFSNYRLRYLDGLEEYRRLFEAACRLGAPLVVFHGDRRESTLPWETYFERYAELHELARRSGVLLAQENVARCRSGDPEFLRRMCSQLPQARFVLDVKQAQRAGSSEQELLELLRGRLAHLHYSEHAPGRDCLPPGEGMGPGPEFLEALRQTGYDAAVIVELYRQNFTDLPQLLRAWRHLEGLCSGVR